MRILFLEDEETLGKLFAKKLQGEFGDDVIWVRKHQEAYDLIECNDFDCYIIDMYLREEKDGFDVIDRIVELGKTGHIVVFTNYLELRKSVPKEIDKVLIKVENSPSKLLEYVKNIRKRETKNIS